jgi:glutathione S-transferase
MPYVAIVTALAILEFMWFSVLVSKARVKYAVVAPNTSGDEMFNRYYRVHMNTLEQLMVFLPALWVFASFVSPIWAAALGAVFVVGRAIYGATYIRDPKSRSLGFGLTMLPSLVMIVGILVWAIRAIVVMAGVPASLP